ncbi:MAG TPA: M28 family peptidase [Thermoleophilaceae bacterium]|nr:M28 family peptidase [Thermoleophilaceae bacterium]
MEAIREIGDLVEHEGRVAGSDAERRAAEHLARRLRALGREAEIEPTSVWPRYALTHAIHALLAVVGSLVSVASPLAGLAVLALAAVSTLGDLTGTVFLVRRLTGRRASQNVTSPEDGGKPGTLILVAHYDAARGGSLFAPRVAERRASLARRLRIPLAPGGLFLIAIVAVLACAVLRLLGIDSTAVAVAQFVPTVALVLSIPLLLDLQLSPPTPGAADNASGVATVLRLAERCGGELEAFDLWVVLTGAQEPGSVGMREWLRAHRRELPRGATVVVNLDRAATGTARYAAREGPVVPVRLDRDLVALCDEIAEEDDDRLGARRMVGRSASDAVLARSRGHRAITISCLDELDHQPHQHQPTDTPERVDPEALERAVQFCSKLLERIDQSLVPGAPEPTS